MTTESIPATVSHEIASPLVVLDQEIVDKAVDLSVAVGQIEKVDESNLEDADELASNLAKLQRQIETNRKEAKSPVLQLGKAIDGAAKPTTDLIKASKKRISSMIAVHINEREEERRRIEAENRRKIEEANRKAEEARRERERKAKPSLLDKVMGKEPEPEPSTPPAPIPVALEKPPEKVKSSVSVRTVKTVEIVDESRIPIEVNNTRLWILDRAAIRRLALAGVPIPGVKVVEVQQTATRAL
jgi:septal ring factor EnvC (AmiA/AmiB activator)